MAKRADSLYEPAPVAALAEGEGAPAAGARGRRLHEGTAQARAHGRARARRPRAGRPALGRQRRHRLLGGRDRRAARAPEAARAARLAARRRCRRCRACGRATSRGSSPSSWSRSSSSSGRTTATCVFPSFLGVRDDKLPEDVRREEPFPTEIRKGKRTLKFSNLDKVFWPEEGLTKGDLLAYYREIAPTILPHLRDRPFTMKRYPDGIDGKFFFQKDAPKHMPEWIPTRRFEVSTRESPRQRRMIDAPLVNDELALLWMVNMACIDMNTWYSRVDKPDRPDWVLFDLDPSPDVGFPEVVEVALLVKSLLDGLGLTGYPKTSGADGMHVLVPIARRSTYAQARELGEIIARTLASTHRGLVTTEWVKRKRRGVLIDANQNGEGKTIASAYSVRPRPGAPVSTPLRWDEVKAEPRPRRLHDGRRPAPRGEGRRPVLRRARGRAVPGAGARVRALTAPRRAAADGRACPAPRCRGGRRARPSSR